MRLQTVADCEQRWRQGHHHRYLARYRCVARYRPPSHTPVEVGEGSWRWYRWDAGGHRHARRLARARGGARVPARPRLRQYLYFCTSKASTFVLVKHAQGLARARGGARVPAPLRRQALYFCTSKGSTFVLQRK